MPRESLDPDGDVVVKKVKLPRELAERLGSLAGLFGESESQILRRGIELVERERKREAARLWLIDAAEGSAKKRGGKPPKKVYPEGR